MIYFCQMNSCHEHYEKQLLVLRDNSNYQSWLFLKIYWNPVFPQCILKKLEDLLLTSGFNVQKNMNVH